MIKFGPYIERKYARSIGSEYYMTGRECINGHVDRKLSTGTACDSCLRNSPERRAYQAEYARKRRMDPEYRSKERTFRDEWLKKDGVKDRIRDSSNQYKRNTYASDPDTRAKKISYKKKYISENSERVKEEKRIWVQNNPEKVKMWNHRRRAHKNIARGLDDSVDIGELFKRSFGFCKYCTTPLFDGYHLDHIVPMSLGGGNTMDNLQCICARCNLRKGAKHPDLWHEEIGWLSGQIKDC